MRSTTSGRVATYGTSCDREDVAAASRIPAASGAPRTPRLRLAGHLPERLQELPGGAVEVLDAAAAVQHLAHLVGDVAAIAARAQAAEERAVVDEAGAEGHGADQVVAADVIGERRVVLQPRLLHVVRDRRVRHVRCELA